MNTRKKKKDLISVNDLSKTAITSRNKFKKSALTLLNRKGYTAIRVEDIARKAGLAKGLFYRYFHDMHDIIHELARDVFDEIGKESQDIPDSLHPYDYLYESIAGPVGHFCNNPGLLACMFELHGAFPQLSQNWKDTSHAWNLRIGDYLAKTTGVSKNVARDLAFVLAAMMEGIIYQDLVRNIQDLKNLGERPEQISEIITICWYRIIFLELPPKQKIKYEKSLLAIPSKSPQ